MRSCCVCGKEDSSYKCPTCKLPYCSVSCCQRHKSVECHPPETNEEEEQAVITKTYNFPTSDTVPIEKLEQLRNSEELKTYLKDDNLRKTMKAVLNDADPTQAIAEAMLNPSFVEFATTCLKIVEPPDLD